MDIRKLNAFFDKNKSKMYAEMHKESQTKLETVRKAKNEKKH